jgi:hypothetical protein
MKTLDNVTMVAIFMNGTPYSCLIIDEIRFWRKKRYCSDGKYKYGITS